MGKKKTFLTRLIFSLAWVYLMNATILPLIIEIDTLWLQLIVGTSFETILLVIWTNLLNSSMLKIGYDVLKK